MSKQLIISVGIPYSGRTTWLNKTYNQEGTVFVLEEKYNGFLKDGKVQEQVFFESLDWVTTQVKQLMEAETPCTQIEVSYFQSRPDHWREVLDLAVAHEYTLTVVYPRNGYLYYPNNKFGRNQEQVDWIKKMTVNRFPRVVKDKKKVKNEDEEEVKENPNLYNNIVVEFMSALAFIMQVNNECSSDPKKWLEKINAQYKPVITRIALEKSRKKAEAEKQAALKAKEEAARAAIEAKKQKVQSEKVKETSDEVTTTPVIEATA